MRDIVISPETQDDIRALCLTYQYSTCFCGHMRRMSKNTLHECYSCISKRVLAAIDPKKETPSSDK
jgi:hypothetical protein